MEQKSKICYLTKGGERKFKCSVAADCFQLFADGTFVTTLIKSLEILKHPPALTDEVKVFYSDADKSKLQIVVPDDALMDDSLMTDATQSSSTALAQDTAELSSLLSQLSPYKTPALIDICSPPRKKMNLSSGDKGGASKSLFNETMQSRSSPELLQGNDENESDSPVEYWGDDVQPLCDIPNSRYIQVINLMDEDYVEEHFKKTLSKVCFQAGIIPSKGTKVVLATQVDPRNNSVVLELSSTEIADWFLMNSSMIYEDRELVFTACTSDFNPCNNESMSSSTPEPCASNVSGTMAPCSLNVNSPEGTTIFLRALLKFKRCFSGNDHSDGEAGVQRELAKQGIDVSLSEIKKKRRNLLNQFRRMQKKENVLWDYYIPCAVLSNDPNFPETKLRGTEFDYWEEDKPRACLNKVPEYDSLTFRKVAVWPTQCVDELIALRKQFWKEFEKPENHSFLWRRVGESLYKKDRRMIYSGQQCENKWDALRKTYKNLKQQVQKSGAEGAIKITTSWPHYSDMDELLSNDVTVEPPVTIALGSTHEMHTSPSEATNQKSDRVGKTRPSTLSRGSPDERAAGLLEIAKEMKERTKVMKERNELLAKMHNTSVVSKDT